MKKVITRIWHGTTKPIHADEYLKYLEVSGLQDYKKMSGNLTTEVWRSIEGEVCHFWTVTKWESIKSIKEFAGEDYEMARYYPDDSRYLLEFEEKVKHYEAFVV